MSSLAKCLSRAGNLVSPIEAKMLKKIARERRADGFTAAEADASVVDEVIQDLEADLDRILAQTKSAATTEPTAPAAPPVVPAVVEKEAAAPAPEPVKEEQAPVAEKEAARPMPKVPEPTAPKTTTGINTAPAAAPAAPVAPKPPVAEAPKPPVAPAPSVVATPPSAKPEPVNVGSANVTGSSPVKTAATQVFEQLGAATPSARIGNRVYPANAAQQSAFQRYGLANAPSVRPTPRSRPSDELVPPAPVAKAPAAAPVPAAQAPQPIQQLQSNIDYLRQKGYGDFADRALNTPQGMAAVAPTTFQRANGPAPIQGFQTAKGTTQPIPAPIPTAKPVAAPAPVVAAPKPTPAPAPAAPAPVAPKAPPRAVPAKMASAALLKRAGVMLSLRGQ